MKKLTLAVDFYFASQKNRRGIGNYTHDLYLSLAKISLIRIILFLPKSGAIDIKQFESVEVIRLPTNSYLLNEIILIPLYSWFKGVDILHYTGNSVSPISTLFGYKVCCTIHDTMFVNFNWNSLGSLMQIFSRFYRLYSLKISAKKLYFVYTVSEYSKVQICKLFKGIDHDRIGITYEGVGFDFIKFAKIKNFNCSTNVNNKIQNSKYFFAIGAKDPRKNVLNIIKSFSIFVSDNLKSNDDIKLIIVGLDSKSIGRYFELCRDFGVQDKVILMGYVTREELFCLYSFSIAFIFLSLEEGFGIPILEAFTAKCPVICSNSTAVAEVGYGASMLVDPLDPEEVSRVMKQVLSEDLRKQLIKSGVINLKKFSWDSISNKFIHFLVEK